MRVLAFRHVPFEDAGLMEPVLHARGIAMEYADLYRPDAAPPDTSDYDALVFLGGPMSVNDALPYLQWERRAILDAMEREQPVLGICLGAQLTASALGARVYASPQKEIGWYDVGLTKVGENDTLFAGWPQTANVFHWHGETFDLPEGAVLLASSERCRHQAFRMGDRTYGIQFHPEVAPETVEAWCREDANAGDLKEIVTPIVCSHTCNEAMALAESVFGRWCDLLKRSHSRRNPG